MGFNGLLSSLSEYVTRFDNFAFIPTFFIKRDRSYKSPLGGYVYIGYILFFLAYILYSLYNFIHQYNQINSVKEDLTKTKIRNFNSSDVQFGVGLLDHEYQNINWNDFPQLEVIVNSYYNGNKKSFNLSYCREDLMYSPEDWNRMSQQDQITTKDLLNSYYVCPDNKFNVSLTTKNWYFTNQSYFEIIVKIKNLSMINSTIDLIQSKRPIIQLIWGSYAFVFSNFLNPISTFIDETRSYLRNNTISNSEITLEPMILYDNQVFGNSLDPYKSVINVNQNDGALFTVGQENIINEEIFDRSKSWIDDKNLFLKRYEFKIGFQRREVTRYRTVFLFFISTVTSVPSLVLFILILIMEKVNVMLAKNHLFKGLFSLKYFKNIQNFQNEYLSRFSVYFFKFRKKK